MCAVQGSAGGGVPQPQGAQAAPSRTGRASCRPQLGRADAGVAGDRCRSPTRRRCPRRRSWWSWSRRRCTRSCRLGRARRRGMRGSCRCRFLFRCRHRTSPPQPPPSRVPPPGPAAAPAAARLPQVQSQAGQDLAGGAGRTVAGACSAATRAPPSAAVAAGSRTAPAGRLPFAGQASGWTQRHVLPGRARARNRTRRRYNPDRRDRARGAAAFRRSPTRRSSRRPDRRRPLVRLAHELVVTQTPDGQAAPAGQASTGVQVQTLTQTSAIHCCLLTALWQWWRSCRPSSCRSRSAPGSMTSRHRGLAGVERLGLTGDEDKREGR